MTPELWTRCPKAVQMGGPGVIAVAVCDCHGMNPAGLVRVPFDEARLRREILAEFGAFIDLARAADSAAYVMSRVRAALGEDT